MPLPWTTKTPLMLAPMQGLTNRALRTVFAKNAKPDVLFTEFVRVRPSGKTRIANNDFIEALAEHADIPLIVQIIGSLDKEVVLACKELVERGVKHINVNMGCPFGRMTSILAGGGMFRFPHKVAPMLDELRQIVPGTLSVKTRLGLDDERQIFEILPIFESAKLDFLILHARTVAQKYKGEANHKCTREVVEQSTLPIIANGDVRDEKQAHAVLQLTGAHGLMLGRGAIADPLLFERIRGQAPTRPKNEPRKHEISKHFLQLLKAYKGIFCGDAQVLSKLKENYVHLDEPELKQWLKKLKKHSHSDALQEFLLKSC